MKKIIVIEDETAIGEKIASILTLEGMSVFYADNGKLGITKALEIKPDLILCDVMMPGIDGYEVLTEIRKSQHLKYTPFLFLTAKSDKKDIRKGMNLGADDYLTKPFAIDELMEAVHSCLRKKIMIEEDVKSEINNFKKEIDSIQSKEKLLSSILNSTQDIITIFHLGTGMIVFFNNRLKKLMPHLTNNDKPMSFLNLVHPDDIEFVLQIPSKIRTLKDEQELYYEYRLISPEGAYLYFLNRVSVFKRDNVGNPLLYLSVLQDITESKEKMKIIEDFYERISDDLSLANSTQAELISFDFPKVDDFKFHIFYKSMEKVGGDFLVTKKLDNGDVDIFAGDVSGHGISSSLVSAMAVVAFKMIDSEDYLPNEILYKLHESLESIVKNHFISGVYLRLSAMQKNLTVSHAGHPPIMLIRDGKVILNNISGTFLILFPSPEYSNYTIDLQKGDMILLFSDGFFEIFNEDKKMLGLNGFVEWVEALTDKPLELIISTLVEKTLTYSNHTVNDDMTLFGLQYE